MNRFNWQQNLQTQPLKDLKIFNNWDVVTNGWYFVCQTKELKKGQAKSFDICSQRLTFFRGEDGKVRALDAFCPHMGVDLGIGKVQGNHIRCFFHHWKFNDKGECVDIPCQKSIPEKSKTQAYDVVEKIGLIWVYPKAQASTRFLEVPDLEGKELEYKLGKKITRACHHHIAMINGIDAQHLRTVHDIQINMELSIKEASRHEIEFELSGKIPTQNFKEKCAKWLLGEDYAYSMKYSDGCLATLTLMKGVKLFGKYDILPRLYMYFAYRNEGPGKTSVWPIFVTEKRKTIIGKIKSKFCLWLTKRMFFALQDEDGQVYENIRFKADNFLKIDSPVAKYIGYINRLEVSKWSRPSAHLNPESTQAFDHPTQQSTNAEI